MAKRSLKVGFSWLTIISGILLFALNATAAPYPRPMSDSLNFNAGKPMSVGLVLSGGGAKGIAHIGVIRALEENNIPIDYIAGTSMGSIVGGLYACGYTPDEMMDLILSEGFSYWSTGRIDPTKVYYFSREAQLPTMHTFEINTTRQTPAEKMEDAVPASLINPLPMNFAFMELFAKYTAQCGGDFNKLMVPFRCVASDVASGHKVVHSSGSVGDAIRTSMSFPIVFQPIKMNGVLLYDGGIFDNFPVDVMTADFAPDFMLGVSVGSSANGPQTSLMDQIDNLVIRKQNKDLPEELGIKLRINLDEFSLLDFQAAKAIEKIGYDHTMAIIDSIKTRVTSRISPVARATRRGVFKSQTPAVVFNKVDVTGGTPAQNHYIEYLFEPAHTDTFGIEHARESYYRAITPGRLKDLFPQAVYNDTTDLFALNLRAIPKDKLSVGVGGYITSSTNSFIFLNAAWRTLTSSSLNFKLNGWIGQSYMAAMFNGSVNLRTPIPSAIGLTLVASGQKFYETDHLFYQVKTPSFIADNEYFARGEYSWAAGARGKFVASVGYGYLYDRFFRSNSRVSYEIGRDHTKESLGQVRIEYNANTLDQLTYPTKGLEYRFTAMGVMGNFKFESADELVPDEWSHPKWIQIESVTRNFWDVSKKFSFGLETDVLFSTRPLSKNYNAAIVTAPTYNPTPAAYNAFNVGYHANSFVGVGLIPVYKINSSLSARANLNCFIPFRKIEENSMSEAQYGKWFSNPEFFGELAVNYALPFANIAAYANYATGRAKPWSVGLSFGVFILAPKFLR